MYTILEVRGGTPQRDTSQIKFVFVNMTPKIEFIDIPYLGGRNVVFVC